jgi:uncharacterized protein YjaZ
MKKNHRLEFCQEGQEEDVRVTLVLYPTAKSILLEFGGNSTLYKKKGMIEGWMPDGNKWKLSLEDAIKYIRARGVWGFYRIDDMEIHLWFRKNVRKKELQAVLAHEMGHWMRPHHYSLAKEEEKAAKYEFVSSFAHDVSEHLIGAVKEGIFT